MLWDAATTLLHTVHLLAQVCSNGYELYRDLKLLYDEDVQPVLGLLGQAKDAVGQVMDAASALQDAKERLFVTNRQECKEMTDRVLLLQQSLEQLRLSHQSSSARAHLDGWVRQLNDALTQVSKVVASNVMPAKLNWLARGSIESVRQ